VVEARTDWVLVDVLIADAWTTAADVASAVAAVAALGAVVLAGLTVKEARTGRREASIQHKRDREEERQFAGLRQLERVQDLLLEIADCARSELTHGIAERRGETPMSRLPVLLIRLRAAIAAYDLLGGVDLPLAKAASVSDPMQSLRVLGDAVSA